MAQLSGKKVTQTFLNADSMLSFIAVKKFNAKGWVQFYADQPQAKII
jgi:hypothetical protein